MEHGATGLNTGDLIATTLVLFIGVIPFVIAIVLFMVYKTTSKRAGARLALEEERTLKLQKQVDDLNSRVTKMEKLLREVE